MPNCERSAATWRRGWGSWGDAEADYAFYVARNPNDFYVQMRLGILLAYLGKTEAYRMHCDGLIARLGSQPLPDAATCFRSVKTCCYLSGGIDHYERLEAFANQAISGNPDFATNWLAAGMAALRMGKAEEALQRLEVGLMAADRRNDVAAKAN